ACATEVCVYQHRAIKVRMVKDRTLQIDTLEVGSVQAGIGKVGTRQAESRSPAERLADRKNARRIRAPLRFIGPPLIGPIGRSQADEDLCASLESRMGGRYATKNDLECTS